MESALIVSHTEKSIAFFTEILSAASINSVSVISSCAEARRLLLDRSFDLVIINAPLCDESGESLSIHIAARCTSQVILVVKNKYFDVVSAACEAAGVLTVSKPINRSVFWSAMHLAKAAQSRLTCMQSENRKLKQKIDDIRIIDRAKYILISYLNMDENEAHRHIEKQAMDTRQTKRAVAELILKTYEN